MKGTRSMKAAPRPKAGVASGVLHFSAAAEKYPKSAAGFRDSPHALGAGMAVASKSRPGHSRASGATA